MEFKFRAVDDRPPTYFPPSSSVGYFPGLSFGAGYSTSDSRGNSDIMSQYSSNARDSMQREIEKEMIREEIITEEIARRRVLEAEVRMELMMEQEMAIRRAAEMGLSFEERLTMRLDPRFPFMHQFDNRWLEHGWAFPGGNVYDTLPLQPPLPDAMAPEIKTPASEVNKDKLIILAKPEPSVSGAKRKAVTPHAAGAGEVPLIGLKKKPKEEWSCALCQVSSTSERALNEHLRGKKHKFKEAGLRAQRMGKNVGAAPLPKKNAKPFKLVKITGSTSLELDTKLEESLQLHKKRVVSNQKMEFTQDLKNKNDELPMQKIRKAQKNPKNIGVATAERVERTAEFRKKNFKFWCEMCRIGAYSEVVIETHKKGKKHMARLQGLNENGEAVPATATASSDATPKAKGAKEVAKEAKEGTTENVIAEAHVSGSSPVAS